MAYTPYSFTIAPRDGETITASVRREPEAGDYIRPFTSLHGSTQVEADEFTVSEPTIFYLSEGGVFYLSMVVDGVERATESGDLRRFHLGGQHSRFVSATVPESSRIVAIASSPTRPHLDLEVGAVTPPGAGYLRLFSRDDDVGETELALRLPDGVTRAIASARGIAGQPMIPLSRFGYYDAGSDITSLLQDAMTAVRDEGHGEQVLIDKPASSSDPFQVDGTLLLHSMVHGIHPMATYLKQVDPAATNAMVRTEWETAQAENVGLAKMTLDVSVADSQHAIRVHNARGLYLESLRAKGQVAPSVASGLIIIGGFTTHTTHDPTVYDIFWHDLYLEDGDNFGLQFGAIDGMWGYGLYAKRCYREVFGIEPGTYNGSPLSATNWHVGGLNIRASTPKAAGSTQTGVIVVTGTSGGVVADGTIDGFEVNVTEVISGDVTPGVQLLDCSGVRVRGTVRNANGAGVRLGNASEAVADCTVEVDVLDCNQGGHASSLAASAGYGLQNAGTTRNTIRGKVRGLLHAFGYLELDGAAGNDVDLDLRSSGAVSYSASAATKIRGETDFPAETSSTAQVTVSGTISATELGHHTIEGGTTRAGDTYRIFAQGSLDQSAVGGTMAFRVRIGGVAGTNLGVINITIPASASTNRSWRYTGEVVFRSPTSAYLVGQVQANLTSGFATAMNALAATTVDVSTDKDLDLDVALPTTGETVRCEVFTVEKVR